MQPVCRVPSPQPSVALVLIQTKRTRINYTADALRTYVLLLLYLNSSIKEGWYALENACTTQLSFGRLIDQQAKLVPVATLLFLTLSRLIPQKHAHSCCVKEQCGAEKAPPAAAGAAGAPGAINVCALSLTFRGWVSLFCFLLCI